MAALGNLALLLDVTSPRSGLLDWKTRPMPADVVLNLFKKDQNPNPSPNPHHHHHNSNPYPYLSFNTAATCFEFGTDNRNPRSGLRGKTKLKVNNAVDYDSSSDDESNSNGNGEEKEGFDWEKQMRQRVKEIQEMKELEKKAEELQSRMDDDDGDGDETEEQKRARVRKELEKVAKEQAERRKTAELMFDLGQRAYGRGMYGRAIEFLEAALTIIPRLTLFGGEIQIWLAMAYDANNRHSDCIGLYLELEKKHPSASIRRQAEELRYILQAPKLKISQEEMVSIPLIGSSYDSYAVTWTDKNKDREERRSGLITNQLPSSKDYLADFLVWRPPVGLEKNQGFWVGLTLWLALVGAALYLQ